jgi:hypothetical protein
MNFNLEYMNFSLIFRFKFYIELEFKSRNFLIINTIINRKGSIISRFPQSLGMINWSLNA